MAECDLERMLVNPAAARKYIADFDWQMPNNIKPNRIMLDSGRDIVFRDMTDEDAVTVAFELLKTVEIPRAIKEFALEWWTH